jgi:hypothetical protein
VVEQEQVGALFVNIDPFFVARADRLVALDAVSSSSSLVALSTRNCRPSAST